MPGQRIPIGPWTGGLNNRLASDQIADNELSVANNVVFTDSGTVRVRPGLQTVAWTIPFTTVTDYKIIGTEFSGASIYASVLYKSTADSWDYFRTNSQKTAASVAFNVYTAAGASGAGYCKMVQYNNLFYFVPLVTTGTASPGRRMTTSGTTPTTIATMPSGRDALLYRDRLFVIGDTRISYSKSTDPSVWAAPDGGFFDVSPGDGQLIRRVVVFNNTMVIFKTSSTWVFSFTTDPAVDGYLRQVLSDQGAVDAVVLNSVLYAVNERSLYLFINNGFQEVARSVVDIREDAPDTTQVLPYLFGMGDFLIFMRPRDHKAAFYNTRNGTWSTASLPSDGFTGWSPIDSDLGYPTVLFSKAGFLFYMEQNNNILDYSASGTSYPAVADVRTKTYDFKTPELWKRLYWYAFNADYGSYSQTGPDTEVNGGGYTGTPDTTYGLEKFSNMQRRFRTLRLGFHSNNAVLPPLGVPITFEIRGFTLYVNNKSPIVK